MRRRLRPWRRVCALAIAAAPALTCTLARPAHAAADPVGAVRALVGGTFSAAGDLIGGAGLVLASGLGTLGDLLGLVDHNPLTRHVLFGVASRPTQALALGVSNGTTGLLEGLRGEDVERLPEPPAAYLDTAPTAGRVDTLLTGLGALALAPGDLLAAPALFALRAVGAGQTADRLERSRADARTSALGPLPAPSRDGDSATLPE